MKKPLTILDTTLRDGAQGEGISFSVKDKLNIVKALDNIGIAFIEAGNPTSNRKEADFFKEASALNLRVSKLCAFGSTRRKELKCNEDASLLSLLDSNTKYISVFGKSSLYHVENVLNTSPENNLCMIEETIFFLKSNNRYVIYDAEHFFDAYKENREYALKTLEAAIKGGCETICLCDTNGGSFPDFIAKAVLEAKKSFPETEIGIHAHNDSDLATAVSLSAVKAGAAHVQGTFLGFGERSGNASLCSIIPNLQLKSDYICIPENNLPMLYQTARQIAEISNISIRNNTPFIGGSAFAHKAGMHADAVMKKSGAYEHILPEAVGNSRHFLISEISGKASVLTRIKKTIPDFDGNTEILSRIISVIKEKEYMGYQFEGAESSIDLIILREAKKIEPFFKLINYKVLDEKPYDTGSATATIKLSVNGVQITTAEDGEGPVNALDKSLRKALSEDFPALREVHLIDYKVRVMEPRDATAAQVRVLITSSDSKKEWTTIGVSQDIIEASWLALVDSIEYKLFNS